MPKIANNTFIATSSITPSLDSDYAIFTSGSNLYFLSASSVQQLNLETGYFRILEYTGSAINNQTSVYTYNVSPLVKLATFVAVGAGGGAGSGGRKDTISIARQAGGGGGAGAGLVVMTLLSQSLDASYTVTVPGAPPGSTGSSTANSSGTAGTTGGNTTIGSIIIAPGGGGGAGGAVSIGNGGDPSQNALPGYLPYFLLGSEGGSSSTTTTPAPGGLQLPTGGKYRTTTFFRNAMNGIRGMAGGGGGGSINTTNTSLTALSGCGVNVYGNLVSAGSIGTGVGGDAVVSPSNVLNAIHLFGISGSLLSCRFGVGAAGSGGASSITPGIPGGRGGDGGYFGAGGGGGGAASGSRAGAGGSGSAGYVAILEFY